MYRVYHRHAASSRATLRHATPRHTTCHAHARTHVRMGVCRYLSTYTAVCPAAWRGVCECERMCAFVLGACMCMHACARVLVSTWRACMRLCVRACARACVCVRVRACAHACVRVWVRAWVRARARACVCACIRCTHAHTHTHTHTQRRTMTSPRICRMDHRMPWQ